MGWDQSKPLCPSHVCLPLSCSQVLSDWKHFKGYLLRLWFSLILFLKIKLGLTSFQLSSSVFWLWRGYWSRRVSITSATATVWALRRGRVTTDTDTRQRRSLYHEGELSRFYLGCRPLSSVGIFFFSRSELACQLLLLRLPEQAYGG